MSVIMTLNETHMACRTKVQTLNCVTVKLLILSFSIQKLCCLVNFHISLPVLLTARFVFFILRMNMH